MSGLGMSQTGMMGGSTMPHAVTAVANAALNQSGNAANLKGKLFVLEVRPPAQPSGNDPSAQRGNEFP